MTKRIKILGIRSGLLGDTVMSLPMLNYLHKKFNNPLITWVVADRFKQGVELYRDHRLINNIYICTGKKDELSDHDLAIHKGYDIIFNVTPSHPSGDSWYSKFTCVEETVRMSWGQWAKDHLGLNSPDELLEDFKKTLTESERKPRLYDYFWGNKTRKDDGQKIIAIWPVAGYAKCGAKRNPPKEFYDDLVKELKANGYIACIYGHPNDFRIDGAGQYYTDFSLIDQVKSTLTCNLMIGTDSGSSWIIGAYGLPQVNLLSNFYPYARKDFWPLAPENSEDLKIDLTSHQGWHDITVEKTLEAIRNYI